MESRLQHPANRRWFGYFLSLAATLVVFWRTLAALMQLSFADERYSHLVLIPIISMGIIFWKKNTIFRDAQYSPVWGGAAAFVGVLLYFASNDLSIRALALVMVWIAEFVVFFGRRSASSAIFPLFFLLFTIPIPTFVLAGAVSGLQEGSAVTSNLLFRFLGVPVIRHGLTFSLPGVEIEIAEQCSGIRSSLSLFITGILASYLLLQSTWKRALFSLLTIPIAIFKNGVRIVALSWLGIYVDQGFLHGRLHQYGGLPVSFLALAILAPIVFALRRSEVSHVSE